MMTTITRDGNSGAASPRQHRAAPGRDRRRAGRPVPGALQRGRGADRGDAGRSAFAAAGAARDRQERAGARADRPHRRARYWEILLSKFTDPKRMFGPVDVAALTRGEYTQVFAGRATQCEIAFIDEIFKCSAGSLNETLAFLNERLYHPESGGAPIACPLISAITASNELPSGEELGAVYDRLLVRLEVGYLQDPSSFAALVKSAVVAPVPAARSTADLAGLRQAVTTGVPAVEGPDGTVDTVCTLRAALRRHELVCSDRRWKQAVRLLQASAYLDGRQAVEATDLAALTAGLGDSTAWR